MGTTIPKIAWGKKLKADEKAKVIEIASDLKVSPDYLMACMAFETGETFSPACKNAAGSSGTGLIQFMRTTAIALGTTVEALAKMTVIEQLDYVYDFFKPFTGKLNTLGDVYMAILWQIAVGKPDSYVLFNKNDTKHPKRYAQNKGLDGNKDGVVSKAETVAKVLAKLEKGLSPKYFG